MKENKNKTIKTKSGKKRVVNKTKRTDVTKTPEALALLEFLNTYAPNHSASIYEVAKAGYITGISDKYRNLAKAAMKISDVKAAFKTIDKTDVDSVNALATIINWLYFNVRQFPFDIWEVRGFFQDIIKKHLAELRSGSVKLTFAKNYDGSSLKLSKWMSIAPGSGSCHDYWFKTFKYYLPGFVIPANYGM